MRNDYTTGSQPRSGLRVISADKVDADLLDPAEVIDGELVTNDPDTDWDGRDTERDAERADLFHGSYLGLVDHDATATYGEAKAAHDAAKGFGGPVDLNKGDDNTDRDDAGAETDAGEPQDVPASLSWAAQDRDTKDGDRPPVIPAWLRSADARKAAVTHARSTAAYYAGFHAVRTPLYVAKGMGYSVVGAGRITGRVTRWATAEDGNRELRAKAAAANDAYTWQALNKVRAKEARGRLWALGLIGVATVSVVAILLATGVLAGPLLWLAVAVAMAVAAHYGRPADKPILGRVTGARKFTKLTGEVVRNALVAIAAKGLTVPEQIEFAHPGIHRDGPGWLARVNLPEGVTAIKVLEKRAELASALRLPIDQVWPSAGPDHPGQLDLWVGYQPASKTGQPRWSLAAEAVRTSFFEDAEFGTDERGRPVTTCLFERSFLVAGQPGSGKTYGARAIATLALLDPTCELKIIELKGTGDFLDMEDLCSTYACGINEETLNAGVDLSRWVLAEAERRGRRIKAARIRGEAPRGKVTPELAATPGAGLHPVLVLVDEVHELFAYSKEAAENFERAIKRLRALGICIVLATQIPDRTSLPPNITRCVTNRWCMSVGGQVENDMVLGTGAFKRGLTGTVYRPKYDAGWGCMTGGEVPGAVRSQFPDDDTWGAILERATSLRGGKAVGAPIETAPARDLLADLTEVAVSNGQHWGPAAEAMNAAWPEAYPHLTADALSELARSAGLASVDVKITGKVRKGYRRTDLNTLRANSAEQAEGGGQLADQSDSQTEAEPETDA